MSNLNLWELVEKTPPEHVKAITGKSYSGTSPKPHYLVRKATKTFGPCGIGWGFEIINERVEDGAGGERLHIARVKVWYMWDGKRGEVEHIGGTPFCGTRKDGKFFTDEDAPKKSVTDALVKALSLIGFAGDIFMGRYDDSKYVSDLKAEEQAAKSPQEPRQRQEAPKASADAEMPSPAALYVQECLRKIARFCAVADLRAWHYGEEHAARTGEFGLTKEQFQQIKAAAVQRKAELEASEARAA